MWKLLSGSKFKSSLIVHLWWRSRPKVVDADAKLRVSARSDWHRESCVNEKGFACHFVWQNGCLFRQCGGRAWKELLRLFISARPNYMVLQKGLISPIQKPNQQLFWLYFSPPFSPKVFLGVCLEPLLVLLRRDIQLGVVQVLETAQEHALISHRSPRDHRHMKQEERWDSWNVTKVKFVDVRKIWQDSWILLTWPDRILLISDWQEQCTYISISKPF